MVKKKRSFQEVTEVTEPVSFEEVTSPHNIRTSLEEIKSYEGVVGYILRNTTSAAIDLKDPTKIIDYAILSSSAIDAGKELSELFNLGEVNNIIIDGKEIRVLSLIVDENKMSVFMEKDSDCERVLRKLRSS